MIERKTIIDKVEIDRDGNVSIRLGLLIVEGEKEIACNWHRITVPEEIPLADHLAAVSAALVAKGELAIPEDAITRITSVVEVMKPNPAGTRQ